MVNRLRILYRFLSRRLSLILGSPTPWIFLLGILAVGLITEGLSKFLDLLSGSEALAAVWTALLGTVLIIIVLLLLDLPGMVRGWITTFRKDSTTVNVETSVPRYRGLIVLVSPGPHRSAEPAMRYHYRGLHDELKEPVLKNCWLLAGPGEGEISSRANADLLKAQFNALGVEVDIWDLRDADDPKEVYQAVQNIYSLAREKHHLEPGEIISDFTGGTKCMTAGMVLACAVGDWNLQYMKPTKYTPGGRAALDAESVPILVDVDFFVIADSNNQ